MGIDEGVRERRDTIQRQRQAQVRPRRADVNALVNADPVRRDALRSDGLADLGRQRFEHRRRRGEVRQRAVELELAGGPDIRQPHAEGRQHPGEGVQEHLLHPQHIRHLAGVLPACAAKAVQRVAGDIVAALDRDFLDGVGHVLNRDAQKALGQLFGAAW